MNATLFISHGAPNIVLGENKTKKNLRKTAQALFKPQYIIVISSHYITKDLRIINPKANEIMYDFYGFEDELYEVKYNINSSRELTENIIKKLKNENINVSIDENRTSFDHGVWSVLALMYEKLEVPVLQLSLPISYSFNELVNLGEKLQIFKDEALMIFSGAITHNLRDMSFNSQIKDYAKEFNSRIRDIVENGNLEELLNIDKDINFSKNHPTIEHFLPLFVAFGNAKNKCGSSINSEILYSNISMESFIFDETK